MSGFDNEVVYLRAVRIEPSVAQDSVIVQQVPNTVGLFNNAGTPEGVVAANPASLCMDRSNGDLYRKSSGTGNTGWVLITAGAGVPTNYVADSGNASPIGNILNLIGGSGLVTTGDTNNTLTIAAGPTIATTFTADGATSASPNFNSFNFSGGTGITTTAFGNGITIDLETPLIVPDGGTGSTSLTDGGIMLGSGTGTVTVTAQPTDGQLLIGSTGSDPVLSTLSSSDSSISIVNGPGSIDLVTGSAIASSYTTDIAGPAIPVSGVLSVVGAGGISTSAVGNTLTITGTGGSAFPWTIIPGTAQTLAINNGYIGSNGTGITYTLPATSSVGDIIEITNIGLGLPTVNQLAGQSVNFTASTTTVGVGGSMTAVEQFASVRLVCVVPNLQWNVISQNGNWSIV